MWSSSDTPLPLTAVFDLCDLKNTVRCKRVCCGHERVQGTEPDAAQWDLTQGRDKYDCTGPVDLHKLWLRRYIVSRVYLT